MTSNNIQMKDTNDGVVVKADGRTLLAKLVFAGSARLAECDLGIDELRAAFKRAHGDEASKVRIRCLKTAVRLLTAISKSQKSKDFYELQPVQPRTSNLGVAAVVTPPIPTGRVAHRARSPTSSTSRTKTCYN